MLDFESLAHDLPELIVVTDPTGHIQWANGTWRSLLGYDPEPLHGQIFWDRVHPDDVTQTRTAIQKTSDSPGRVRLIHRLRDAQGAWVRIAWLLSAREGGWVGAGRPAESYGLASLRLAQRVANLGHWRHDAVSDELVWSDEVFGAFGQDAATHAPSWASMLQGYHPDDRERVRHAQQRAEEVGEDYDLQVRVVQPEGDVRWVRTAGGVERGDNDRLVRFGVVEDLTARYQSLLQSNRELEAFAHAIAHDLRAPLRSVIGFTRMLRETLPDELEQGGAEYFAHIVSGAQRMSHLIDELLKYARVVGQAEPFRVIDLNALIDDVLTLLESPVAESNAHIDVQELPSVMGRPGQLTSLFQNLIDNALKYRSERALRIRIEPEERNQGLIAIAVHDNGRGFDPASAESLFRPFRRGRERPSPTSGMGMGLAISKRIAASHGGHITAESQLDGGSTFRVWLPLA